MPRAHLMHRNPQSIPQPLPPSVSRRPRPSFHLTAFPAPSQCVDHAAPPSTPSTCHSRPPPHPMPPGRRQYSGTRYRHPSDTHEPTFFFLAIFFSSSSQDRATAMLTHHYGPRSPPLDSRTLQPPPSLTPARKEILRKAIGDAPRRLRCRLPKAFSSKPNRDRIPRLLRCRSPKAISSKPNQVPSPVDSGHLRRWSLHATSAIRYRTLMHAADQFRRLRAPNTFAAASPYQDHRLPAYSRTPSTFCCFADPLLYPPSQRIQQHSDIHAYHLRASTQVQIIFFFFSRFFFFLRRIGIRRSRIQVSGAFSLTSDPSSHTSSQPTPSASRRDLLRPRTPSSSPTPLFTNSLRTTRLGLRTSDPANPFLCYHQPLLHPDVAPCLRRVHRLTPTSSLTFDTSVHPSSTPSWLTGTSTFKRSKRV